MTTWDLLTANSDAPIGSTAWVHINSITGGGDGDTVIVLGELTSSVSTTLTSSVDVDLTSNITTHELSSNIDSEINTGITT